MKLHCCYTPSHRVLYERFFRPSLDASEFRLVPSELTQTGEGEFLAEDFKAAIAFKLRRIIESIRENMGEIIAWSDVDIQFFGLKRSHVLAYFEPETDLAIQKLHPREGAVCGGFYAIRCSEKTALFFEKTLEITSAETNGNEQDALNLLLGEIPAPLNWKFLGPEFYARTHGLRIPGNAVLHHATCILPGDHVRQKTALLSALEGYEKWGRSRRQAYLARNGLDALARCGCGPAHLSVDTVAGIDLLRGAFAILVLLSHCWVSALRNSPHSGEPLLRFVTVTLGQGGIWVTGFFVLSGFCIHLSVRNSQARGRYSEGDYLWARATRIYPLFLAGLLVADVARRAASARAQWPQILGSLFLLQGFTGQVFAYSQSWSITNEAVYYLAWPLALRVFGRDGARASILAGATALGITAAVVVVWKVFDRGSAASWLVPFWTISANSIPWFAGAFLASVWNGLLARERAAALACRSLWIALPLVYGVQGWLNYRQGKAFWSFANSYLAALVFMLLILAMRNGVFGRKLPALRPVCAWLGLLSYPLYLLHEQIKVLCVACLGRLGMAPGVAGAFFLFLFVCLVVVAALGAPLEAAILRRRARWLGKTPHEAAYEKSGAPLAAPTSRAGE